MGACAMDAGMCSRHSGAQPGGGICAICLQERLILLWRGEGNSNWDTEEFSVTPPLELRAGSKSPPVDEPSPAEDALRFETAAGSARGATAASACFPVLFRVRRHLRRDVDEHESSKEREKIDRSSRLGDGASDREREFSCELKTIVKELSALHAKKTTAWKSEKAAVKIRSGASDSGCFSGRRPQHEEVAADVSQRAAACAPQSSGADAASAVPPPPGDNDAATTSHRRVAKSRAASVVAPDDDDDDADDADPRSNVKSLQCFSVLWPAVVNMKWARALVSPIMSSNKIAPSKSDLLAKMVHGAAAGGGAGEWARPESGNCETSGENCPLEQEREHFGAGGAAGAVALTPSRWLQPAADEDETVLELDKETQLRMEASRITVMTWLESLPSPKAAHLELTTRDAIPDALSVGNGVLEMCDEEEAFDDVVVRSQDEADPPADNIRLAAPFEFGVDPTTSEPPTSEFRNAPTSSAADVYARMSSFGKFLRLPSAQIHAPARPAEAEIAAQ